MTLARTLEAERKRQDLTVYRFAKLAGMSAGRMHAILDGVTANPGIFTLLDVLTALGKDLPWLAAQRGALTPPAPAAK
jgi:transcriptional regulator with XRE-family HTH domain